MLFRKAISAFFLILLTPIMFIVSIIIFLSDGLPVLFLQKRVGINNGFFLLYKFRTMKKNTPEVATDSLKNYEDHYIKFGYLMRKLSIDEIPQLLNILKGDMHFIGPRPAFYKQDKLIALRSEKNIDSLRPGITGWAQVNGRDTISIEEKVKLDQYYLENKNSSLDLKIIFITVLKVFMIKDVKG
jgi:O-antigen biosynthesis protein WbqP